MNARVVRLISQALTAVAQETPDPKYAADMLRKAANEIEGRHRPPKKEKSPWVNKW